MHPCMAMYARTVQTVLGGLTPVHAGCMAEEAFIMVMHCADGAGGIDASACRLHGGGSIHGDALCRRYEGDGCMDAWTVRCMDRGAWRCMYAWRCMPTSEVGDERTAGRLIGGSGIERVGCFKIDAFDSEPDT